MVFMIACSAVFIFVPSAFWFFFKCPSRSCEILNSCIDKRNSYSVNVQYNNWPLLKRLWVEWMLDVSEDLCIEFIVVGHDLLMVLHGFGLYCYLWLFIRKEAERWFMFWCEKYVFYSLVDGKVHWSSISVTIRWSGNFRWIWHNNWGELWKMRIK